MKVPVYYTKTIQKGKNLASLEACEARIRQIALNPKSSYYTALQEGRVHIHHDAGAYTPRWHVVALHEEEAMDIEGNLACGECGEKYFSAIKDYLCESCRSKIDEQTPAW
jgi:hypothetical protein